MISASLLRKHGFCVHIIDGRVDPRWLIKVKTIQSDYDWIALTSSPLDRWQCPNLEIGHFIKIARKLPSEKLIIMGAHGSLAPEAILRKTDARAVIVGEPERTLLNLLSQNAWDKTAGLVFRRNKEIVSTGTAELADLAEWPLPAFDLVDFSRYQYELLGRRFALFEGSRGCPYQCRYCLKVMYGEGVRFKPIPQMVEEVGHAVHKFGVRCGYFFDLEFTIHRSRIMQFCDQLIYQKYPFIWCCQTRPDAVDIELLSKMKQAGCRLIHYGIETGNQQLLNDINKKVNLDTIQASIKMTREAGIDSACFFLFGFPGETKKNMLQTIALAKTLNPTYASFHTVTPYPGTSIYAQCARAGSKLEKNLYYPQTCPEHDPRLLDAIVKKALRSFYLRPGYVIDRLRKGNLRSWLGQIRLFKEFMT
ncbi:MAG: radical SAM protein [Deltaproteobacteria bacterium]|nr:radical SAM protein [Deltaproteobacteria bacterium]